MSRDTVDSLHEAEDALGFCGAKLRELQVMVGGACAAGVYIDPFKLKPIIDEAVNHERDYCRCPINDEWGDDGEMIGGYDCADDCGCPADHDEPHHETDEQYEARKGLTPTEAP